MVSLWSSLFISTISPFSSFTLLIISYLKSSLIKITLSLSFLVAWNICGKLSSVFLFKLYFLLNELFCPFSTLYLSLFLYIFHLYSVFNVVFLKAFDLLWNRVGTFLLTFFSTDPTPVRLLLKMPFQEKQWVL